MLGNGQSRMLRRPSPALLGLLLGVPAEILFDPDAGDDGDRDDDVLEMEGQRVLTRTEATGTDDACCNLPVVERVVANQEEVLESL